VQEVSDPAACQDGGSKAQVSMIIIGAHWERSWSILAKRKENGRQVMGTP
jgi:hypothetical protein